MSTQLETPVISLAVENNTTIKISGLSVDHASGYQIKIFTLSGAGVPERVYPVEGVVYYKNLYPRSVYYVSARALGDDEDYLNSEWSTEQSIITSTDTDTNIDIPQIAVTKHSFTALYLSNMVSGARYRYQIATSVAALDSCAPHIIGCRQAGIAYITGLEPGTQYYIRFCRIRGKKCSLWSDAVAASTYAVNNTVEITSSDDSGEGTLRQAVTNAVDGTKILLKVSTITLNSVISSAKHIYIIGALSEKTVISPGNSNALFSGNYITGRNIKFTGDCAANLPVYGGIWVDCQIDTLVSTYSGGLFRGAIIGDCLFANTTHKNGACRESYVYNSVFDSCRCTATGNQAGGGAVCQYVVCNCTARNCSTTGIGGAFNDVFAFNCLVDNNVSINGGGVYGGTSVDCVVTNNYSSNSGGGISGGTCYGCVIDGNNANLFGSGVYHGVCHECVITNNQKQGFNGGSYYNCLIVNNASDDAHFTYNDDGLLYNCTVGTCGNNDRQSRTYVRNTLYKTMNWAGLAGNSNNLSYDGNETSYFMDSAKGDYRLKYGSPSINAGANQYINGDYDLAGNPRINGTTVDVGAYEYESYKLDVPTFNITACGSGECKITFTLPLGASAFKLQYADNSDFTNAQELSSASSAFDLSGLSGLMYFRGQAVGIPGVTLDSDWTDSQNYYFDVTAPVIVMAREPIEMSLGDTVDFLAGVAVSDDHDPNVSVHYQIIDRYNQPVVVDGEDTDIPSSGIPIGNYVLKITASDNAGNSAVSDRGLAVLPPLLQAPTISIQSVGKYSAEVSGLVNANASGWLLQVDGTEQTVSPVNGKATITGLDPSIAHVVQAKALGDWVQPEPPTPPSGIWRDSVWSNEVSVSLAGVAFFKWVAEVVLSHKDRTFQNAEIRAKILDKDTGEFLPPSMVSEAQFTCWRLNADGTRTAVTGFDAVAVPNSAFSAAADDDGFNFTYVPDQTVNRMCASPGRYLLGVSVTLTAGNPFDVYSEVITLY